MGYEKALLKLGHEVGHAWLTIEETESYLQSIITDMDGLDIEHQVLACPTFSAAGFADDEFNRYWIQAGNDFLAEVCHMHPDRFSGFFGVPLRNVSDAVDELKRIARSQGMVGLIVGSHIGEVALDSPELQPFYEEADKLGLTILVHPELPAGIELTPGYQKLNDLYKFIGFLFDTTMAVIRLAYAGIFERYKNLNLIASHLGGMLSFVSPSVDIMWEKMVKEGADKCLKQPSEYFKRLYADTGRPLNTATLQCALSLFGEDHILFGTDLPNWRIEEIDASRRIVSAIEAMELSTVTKEKIFYGNAKKLLKL